MEAPTSSPARPPATPFLAIDGPIGVGKTTLARLIAQQMGAGLLEERFADNPFLPLFYAEPQRYAWPTQLHFLTDRFDQWGEVAAAGGALVSDYLFDKDRLFAELTLDAPQLRRYAKVFAALRGQLRQPTGVIFLRADVEALLARIAARARPYERPIERAYLAALSDAYERFFATYRAAPVLTIDTTTRDVVRNADDRAAVLAMIAQAFPAEPPW